MNPKHESHTPEDKSSIAMPLVFIILSVILKVGFFLLSPPLALTIFVEVASSAFFFIGLVQLVSRKLGMTAAVWWKKNRKAIGIAMLVSTLVVGIPLICIFSNSGSSSSSGSNSKIAECKVCEREFEAGDRAGNYKSIARTGMCNNCYKNYQWGKEYID